MIRFRVHIGFMFLKLGLKILGDTGQDEMIRYGKETGLLANPPVDAEVWHAHVDMSETRSVTRSHQHEGGGEDHEHDGEEVRYEETSDQDRSTVVPLGVGNVPRIAHDGTEAIQPSGSSLIRRARPW